MTGEGRKDDNAKLRFDLIPPEAELALAAVLTYGAEKYSSRNWEKGFDWLRAYAALRRHLTAWSMGEELDEESGLPHLWHALAEAAFLVTFALRRAGTDNRTEFRVLVPYQSFHSLTLDAVRRVRGLSTYD